MTLYELFCRYNFHDGTALLQRETPGETLKICFVLAGWDQLPEVMAQDPDAKSKPLIVQAVFHGCSDLRVKRSVLVPAGAAAAGNAPHNDPKKKRTDAAGTWVDMSITYAERDIGLEVNEMMLDPTNTVISIYTWGSGVQEETSFSAQSVEVKAYYASHEEEKRLYDEYYG